jgi:hypothetical protein
MELDPDPEVRIRGSGSAPKNVTDPQHWPDMYENFPSLHKLARWCVR